MYLVLNTVSWSFWMFVFPVKSHLYAEKVIHWPHVLDSVGCIRFCNVIACFSCRFTKLEKKLADTGACDGLPFHAARLMFIQYSAYVITSKYIGSVLVFIYYYSFSTLFVCLAKRSSKAPYSWTDLLTWVFICVYAELDRQWSGIYTITSHILPSIPKGKEGNTQNLINVHKRHAQ